MKTASYPFQKKGITNFFVRPEIAKHVFCTDYSKSGTHIQVTPEEYDALSDIEGSKTRAFWDKQSILIAKVKEVVRAQDAEQNV